MKNSQIGTWIVLGVLTVAPAAYGNVNLVNNGSFEPPTAAHGTPPAPGTCGVIPGWDCSIAATTGANNNVGLWSIQYQDPAAFFNANAVTDNAASPSPDTAGAGAIYLVDDGSADPLVETLSQKITVTQGQTYNVGFDLFELANGSGNANTSSVALSVGGTSYASIVTNTLSPSWKNFNYLYTAGTSGLVSFTITYTGGVYTGQDMLLDRAYAVTPEPGFYGIVGVGLAGIFAAVRRRRQQAL